MNPDDPRRDEFLQTIKTFEQLLHPNDFKQKASDFIGRIHNMLKKKYISNDRDNNSIYIEPIINRIQIEDTKFDFEYIICSCLEDANRYIHEDANVILDVFFKNTVDIIIHHEQYVIRYDLKDFMTSNFFMTIQGVTNPNLFINEKINTKFDTNTKSYMINFKSPIIPESKKTIPTNITGVIINETNDDWLFSVVEHKTNRKIKWIQCKKNDTNKMRSIDITIRLMWHGIKEFEDDPGVVVR